jgi:hypothetical protein
VSDQLSATVTTAEVLATAPALLRHVLGGVFAATQSDDVAMLAVRVAG